MWKSKEDTKIEELLSRYRPAEPPNDLWAQISTFPNSHISKSERTWPWAVAAAALLAVSIGLHAAVAPAPETSVVVDAARLQAIVDELGGSSESRIMAEWIARREAMLEQERLAQASAPGPERQ
jgi:hypothetical protein